MPSLVLIDGKLVNSLRVHSSRTVSSSALQEHTFYEGSCHLIRFGTLSGYYVEGVSTHRH